VPLRVALQVRQITAIESHEAFVFFNSRLATQSKHSAAIVTSVTDSVAS